ncbi:AAA family ATPase [Pseudalkalibacillus caeni]|uniref:AAA family ATPase n=1 Tax=Exobacillus caeni TaxID=2574798 RepID=A0A5R9EY86_9BACL|nr:AAA family ATPase [Pseudalkalibacillus caeni]TLS35459.1 AAA family ATPase [Pseudalkalibacillus caeni]
MKIQKKMLIFISLILAVLISTTAIYLNLQDQTTEQSVGKFELLLNSEKASQITNVHVSEAKRSIQYTYNNESYKVQYPEGNYLVEKDILQKLEKADGEVNFTNKVEQGVIDKVLESLLPISILLAVGVIAMKQMSKPNTLVYVEKEQTTFKDLAGYPYVKEEIQEAVHYLNNATEYARFTTKPLKGLLMEGPPGNGKTLFAKAIAGESNTPFFQISASDIEDKYVGSGSKKIENIFKEVRKKVKESGKAILFIDELDAIGSKRENRSVQETNQTINKLLTELDGFEKETNILVIGATNLASNLDTALTRSGRFDRIINVPKPNLNDRKEIIELYLRKKGEVVDPELFEENYAYTLAQQTEGMCNADLDKLINVEASILAYKQEKSVIDRECLREAFTKMVAGLKTDHKVRQEDRELIAYHEAGHAVAQILTNPEGYKSVAYITITPHGQSLGHVVPVSEDRVLLKKSDLENELKVLLAGRAVEDIILEGDYTTGAAQDLQQANKKLLSYVTKYGMSEDVENLFIEQVDENNAIVQQELRSIRGRLYNDTKTMIKENWNLIESITNELLIKETIDQPRLKEICDQYNNIVAV